MKYYIHTPVVIIEYQRYHGVSILKVQLDWLLKEKHLEKQALTKYRAAVSRRLMHNGTSVTLVLGSDICIDELER